MCTFTNYIYSLTYLLTCVRAAFAVDFWLQIDRKSNRQIINLAKLAFRPRKVTDYSMHKKFMPVTILRTWTVSSHY